MSKLDAVINLRSRLNQLDLVGQGRGWHADSDNPHVAGAKAGGGGGEDRSRAAVSKAAGDTPSVAANAKFEAAKAWLKENGMDNAHLDKDGVDPDSDKAAPPTAASVIDQANAELAKSGLSLPPEHAKAIVEALTPKPTEESEWSKRTQAKRTGAEVRVIRDKKGLSDTLDALIEVRTRLLGEIDLVGQGRGWHADSDNPHVAGAKAAGGEWDGKGKSGNVPGVTTTTNPRANVSKPGSESERWATAADGARTRGGSENAKKVDAVDHTAKHTAVKYGDGAIALFTKGAASLNPSVRNTDFQEWHVPSNGAGRTDKMLPASMKDKSLSASALDALIDVRTRLIGEVDLVGQGRGWHADGDNPHVAGAKAAGSGDGDREAKTSGGSVSWDRAESTMEDRAGGPKAGAAQPWVSTASADSIPRSAFKEGQHQKALASENFHTKTMAEMKDKSDDSLRYIHKDANEAAKANPGGSKAGQYTDTALYAARELQERNTYRESSKSGVAQSGPRWRTSDGRKPK